MCHTDQIPLTALTDLKLTSEETTVLNLVRNFFLNFAEPGSHSWVRAVATTHAQFETDRAWPIFTSTLQMVMAMRTARRSAFLFSNPNCPGCAQKATDNERQFLNVLRSARLGNIEAMRGHALLLCEGNETEDYVVAVQNVATLLKSSPTDAAPKRVVSPPGGANPCCGSEGRSAGRAA